LGSNRALEAYTGGPIRAQLVGYDPTEAKLFYRLSYHDESGRRDGVFYMSLDGSEPDASTWASSLEHDQRGRWPEEVSERWRWLLARLLPLRAPDNYEYSVVMDADSVGRTRGGAVDTVEYKLHFKLTTAFGDAEMDTTAYCQPEVWVRGLYQIPNRPEQVVVVSVIGRLYACEPTDVVLLVRNRARRE
jgi:hypothetical protein